MLFLSNLKCFDQFPCIFFLLSSEKRYWLKSLCLPAVFEESHCNEKQSSSINSTTCSAGNISYLLLNGLIGSELGKKGVERFFWFWCEGAKCFPCENILTLLFGLVGLWCWCVCGFEHNWVYQYHFSAESLQSHSENVHCIISLSISLYSGSVFIKTSTFIKYNHYTLHNRQWQEKAFIWWFIMISSIFACLSNLIVSDLQTELMIRQRQPA